MATNNEFDPTKYGATRFDPRALGATPFEEAPTPEKRPSFGEFLKGEVTGQPQRPETFTRGLIQSTVGSRGILGVGQLPGRTIATGFLAGSERDLENSRGVLAGATTRLIRKIRELPEDDPKRETLQRIVDENQRTLGQAQETSGAITGAQTTGKEAAGTTLNALLTLAPGVTTKGITQAVRAGGVVGKVAPLLSPIARTPVFGIQGAKPFITAAGKRALQTGLQFGGFTAAEGLIDDKQADEIAKNSAIAFGLGALGSGLFSALVTAPLTAATTERATSRLFRAGLGFGKASQRMEEKQNKLASDILIKHGAGTADQLKQRYEKLATQAENDIQNAIKSYQRSTGRGGAFRSEDILRDIERAYRSQFSKSLSDKEIKAFVQQLPLDVLHRKPIVNITELNALRREITNKLLSPTAFTRQGVQEGVTRQLMTAGGVLAEKVKNTVRATRPIYERYSAYIKGFDALLNRLSTTTGPVNTGSRIAGMGAAGLAGFGVGGVVGAGAGIGVEELARSTLGRTGLAVLLRKLGIAGQKLGQNELNTLGQTLVKLGIIQGFTPESDQ